MKKPKLKKLTPREQEILDKKTTLLIELGKPVTEENLDKVTIHTKWETMR